MMGHSSFCRGLQTEKFENPCFNPIKHEKKEKHFRTHLYPSSVMCWQ